MNINWTSAFLLGLGGSIHCIGMCGPLIMTVPFGDNYYKILGRTILYHFSRILIYGVMGLIAGLVGQGLDMVHIQQYLSIFAGVVLIVMFFRHNINMHIVSGRLTAWTRNWFSAFWKLNSFWKFIGLGIINGLLPCGLVYTAIGSAMVSTQTPIMGLIYMLLFGLGTFPAMISISVLGKNINLKYKNRLRILSRVFTLIVGILLILRGLNLGIPYLSPELANGNLIHSLYFLSS